MTAPSRPATVEVDINKAQTPALRRALLQSPPAALLAQAFDAAPNGFMLVDEDGTIVAANCALETMLGYPNGTLLGQPMAKLIPQRHRDGHADLMAGYHLAGRARPMGQGRDLTALCAGGRELPVEVGLSQVHWQGRPLAMAAVTDIGVRKQLEAELRQANADLEEFTFVASHDLRSPLRGIGDLVEWITADLGAAAPPEVTRNLGRISQRTRRLEQVIGELLAYSRAGHASRSPDRIDLDALVRGILEMQPLPSGFEIDLDIVLPAFHGSRIPLETALRNLLANAVKHHDRAQGRLRVVARQEATHCEISVIDDGPGIAQRAREWMFEHVPAPLGHAAGVAGFGLALTKRLINTHGGRIDVVSPFAQGRGSCFLISWPLFSPDTTR